MEAAQNDLQGLLVCEGDLGLTVSGVQVYWLGIQSVGMALADHGGSTIGLARSISG